MAAQDRFLRDSICLPSARIAQSCLRPVAGRSRRQLWLNGAEATVDFGTEVRSAELDPDRRLLLKPPQPAFKDPAAGDHIACCDSSDETIQS